jgi:mycofactocin system glycosyltransferase
MGASAAPVRPRSRVPYVPTAALVVRRAALEEVGGFDPGLRFGEDVDLVWRLVAAGHRVRYDPAVTVAHAVRPTLRAWLRQRFDYGGSAAALAERHGPAVAPLTVSPWSAGAWALVAVGHPLLGAAVAGASTAALVPRLRPLQHPWSEAVRLAGGGHLRTGRLMVEACRRSWWPLVLVACLASRRARRAALVGALVPLLERRPTVERLGPLAWVALRLADDLGYGLGVWAGAWRARSLTALRPDIAFRPAAASPSG